VYGTIGKKLGKEQERPFSTDRNFPLPVHFVQSKECKKFLVVPTSNTNDRRYDEINISDTRGQY
jgi:hypothetical protein